MDADGSDVFQVTDSRNDQGNPDWQPLPPPTKTKPERRQEQRQQNKQKRQPEQGPKNRSVTVHPPDTGGPPYLAVSAVLLLGAAVLAGRGVLRR
jgi:hypothetical protein